MRRADLLLWLAAVGAIGCGDLPVGPVNEPESLAGPGSGEAYTIFQLPPPATTVIGPGVELLADLIAPSVVSPPALLEELVAQLFTEPGHFQAASAQLRNILRDLAEGDGGSALEKARDFREFALTRLENGQLNDPNGAAPPSTSEAVVLLLNSLFEIVGVPGGQLLELSRKVYGSPLIDGVDPGQFPRGGTYLATISGVGIERADGMTVDQSHVFGHVLGSPGPGLLTVLIGSDAVGPGETALAEILDVPFLLTSDLSPGVPLVVGHGTLDIVRGPKPVATALDIVGDVRELPRGQSTAVDFSLHVTSAGNLKFMFVGCALCRVAFTGYDGDQFEHNLTFTVTWDVPIDYGWPDFGLGSGGVNGADEEGRLEISVPVVGP